MRLEGLLYFGELLSVAVIPPPVVLAPAVCTLQRFQFLPFGLLMLWEIGKLLIFDTFPEMRLDSTSYT